MREDAERTDAGTERAQRIFTIENVVVLVKRRAVADLGVLVNGFRASRKFLEELAVVRRERLVCPDSGQTRDLVEVAPILDAARRLVVVAADDRNWIRPRMRSITSFGAAP